MLRSMKPFREDWAALTLPWVTPLAATAMALLLKPVVPVANLALIYVAGVLITAVNTRPRPALVCALLSFVAYNFFLTEPRFTLQMLHEEDVLTALMMVMVALLTGHLAARQREQLAALQESETWSSRQMACANSLATCVDGRELVKAFAVQLQQALGWHARVHEGVPEDSPHSSGARDVRWVSDHGGITVLFSGAGGEVVASIRVSATEPLSDLHRSRIDALVNVARLAWSRVQFADSLRQETLDKEREQLRSALLSSVSHDLRTPLATMIGSVSSLLDLSDALSTEQRAELLANTLSEARRLDRYIQKLLDMTRLGHGELSLDRDWVGLDDIVSVAVRRLRPLLGDIDLKLDIPRNLPLLYVHPALVEQALFNVLENAVRYSPPGGRIWCSAERDGSWLHLDVRDQGPGISAADREQIFDMFHTVSHGDQYPAGTGLGLAICRSILAAHGGRAEVLSTGSDRGTTLRLTLPLTEADASGENERSEFMGEQDV